ncbi:DUF4148 domain-containing protein [Paraburkholderia sp. UCT31]|uniref:DUF4148 domain-containing protein n=1 Tax=Paraburkholderia sp. UCT31 TaxID=2615209 RepID=UPI00165639D5|nr:DUF4148 domain-containing protein [Paraburkholderia sp. UCT31]MBC8738578.1 DUF4148 domain-containing protein [Paraburkholderia sp. UCT31]
MKTALLASSLVLSLLAAPAFANGNSNGPGGHGSHPSYTADPVGGTAASAPKTRAEVKAELKAYLAAGEPGSEVYRGQ